MGDIHALYEKRERQCIARYPEKAARERCLLIMDLERFQSRSIAIFNRTALVLGPPLIGLGAMAFLRRKSAGKSRKGPRK